MAKGSGGGRGAVGRQQVSAKSGGITKAVNELLATIGGPGGNARMDAEGLSQEARDAAIGITLFTRGHVDAVVDPTKHNGTDNLLENWHLRDSRMADGAFRVRGNRANYETAHRTVTAMARAKLAVPISVHRGMSLPSELAAGLKVGDTFTFREAASTSKSQHVANGFAQSERAKRGGNMVVFSFTAKRGTDISQLSHFRDEAEIVTGGAVRIKSIRHLDGVYYVQAEQRSR